MTFERVLEYDSVVRGGPPARAGTSRGAPIVAIAILTLIVVIALSSGLLTRTVLPDATAIAPSLRYRPPWPLEGSSASHLLGTDRIGRDLLSRLVVGARLSLSIAGLAILFAASFGTAVGLISGYSGRWVDVVCMRAVDIMLSFPAILIALMFVFTIGASYWMVVTILGALLWAHFARLVRVEVLSWKERGFVALARVAGASPLRIIVRHLLPNILSSVVVLATLQVGWAIVVESTLSFLGAGVPPPAPTWGNMVAEGRDVLDEAWWISVFPGFGIMIVVLSLNLLGDWLRDALDPRLRQL